MKRHNFDLVEAQEKIAAQQQCIVCLCGSLLASTGMAAICYLGVAQTWMMICGSILLLFFLALALAFAFIPEIKARNREMEMWHEDNGSYVDPHHKEM